MELAVDRLTANLGERQIDGYLIDAPGDDPDQRYVSGFAGHDAFISLVTDGDVHLLVRGLDRSLAREQSSATSVTSPQAFGDEIEDSTDDIAVLAHFLANYGVNTVAVPRRFPVAKADGLRELGITVEPDHDHLVRNLRAIKQESEIEHIRRAQKATERAMQRAEALLARTTIVDDQLEFDGEPLTSERVKEAIATGLLRDGYIAEDVIVACGADAAKPHERGMGALRPHETIVIDIFPRDVTTHYHADMTRTFCVGEPSDTATQWYDLTVAAQDAAFEALEPGISSDVVHDAVCEVFEDAGIPTHRSDPATEIGFTHGTGHGVGLAVHDPPRISFTDPEVLQPGHVVTIEPGLYDPIVGGIRIEDLVVITEDGFENLTEYERRFVL